MVTDLDRALNEAFVKVFGKKFRPVSAEMELPRQSARKTTKTERPETYSRTLSINSRAWRDQVAMKLLDGYGAEDIAVWLNCHVSHVQAEVKRLRSRGMLAKWWGSQ